MTDLVDGFACVAGVDRVDRFDVGLGGGLRGEQLLVDPEADRIDPAGEAVDEVAR